MRNLKFLGVSFLLAMTAATSGVAQNPIIQTKYTADPAPMVYNDIQATFTQAAGRKVYSSWSYNCRVDKTSFSYSGGQSTIICLSSTRSTAWFAAMMIFLLFGRINTVFAFTCSIALSLSLIHIFLRC